MIPFVSLLLILNQSCATIASLDEGFGFESIGDQASSKSISDNGDSIAKKSDLFATNESIYRNGDILVDLGGDRDRRGIMETYVPRNSSIFSPFSSHERLSDQFQIKSTEKLIKISGDQVDLCLQATELSVGSKVITQTCTNSRMNQKWTVDEYGRFHTVGDENLCISKGTKSTIILSYCGSIGLNKNMFVLNAFENTINWRKNGLKVFSVNGDEPKLAKPISIPRRKLSKKMQQWNIVPSTLFLSTEDLPNDFHIKSLSLSSCLEASSLEIASSLRLSTCDESNTNQIWNVNQFGLIHSVGDNSKCIVKNISNLEIGACQKTNNNMFMFDVTDSSIVLKRNGLKAFFANFQGNVILSNKKTFNLRQMWSLETIVTVEVEYVGNPCTAEFSSGKCAVCTGDCDSDSDCESGLRCAQRRRSDGLEIVPGCVWGSTSLRMDDSDYCEYPICI